MEHTKLFLIIVQILIGRFRSIHKYYVNLGDTNCARPLPFANSLFPSISLLFPSLFGPNLDMENSKAPAQFPYYALKIEPSFFIYCSLIDQLTLLILFYRSYSFFLRSSFLKCIYIYFFYLNKQIWKWSRGPWLSPLRLSFEK